MARVRPEPRDLPSRSVICLRRSGGELPGGGRAAPGGSQPVAECARICSPVRAKRNYNRIDARACWPRPAKSTTMGLFSDRREPGGHCWGRRLDVALRVTGKDVSYVRF